MDAGDYKWTVKVTQGSKLHKVQKEFLTVSAMYTGTSNDTEPMPKPAMARPA
jgi:hypothetical protein